MLDDRFRKRVVAVFAVMLMMLSAVPFICESDESSAAGSYFKYTLTNGSGTSINVKAEGAPLKDFDSHGYGPFRSFYAAFDSTNDNRMIGHLNPNNLGMVYTESINKEYQSYFKNYNNTYSTASDALWTKVNIMWCLPTIYWYVENGSLVLTDNPSRGEAFAHTINSKTTGPYNYLAIGVYEAYKNDNILMSKPYVTPSANISLADFRTYANNVVINTDGGEGSNGDAGLWNYYQFQLYRLCALAYTGDYDVQLAIGYGNVGGKASSTTGYWNQKGPVGGTSTASTDGVKLYIENAWGSLYDHVDDAYFGGGLLYAGQNSTGITSDIKGKNLTNITANINGWGSHPDTEHADTWGMPTADTGGYRKGTCDSFKSNGGGPLIVGGPWIGGEGAGISDLDDGTNYAGENRGTRLAFVFDDDPSVYNIELDHGNLEDAGGDVTHLTTELKSPIIDTYPDLNGISDNPSISAGWTHIGWEVEGEFIPINTTITLKSYHVAKSIWSPPGNHGESVSWKCTVTIDNSNGTIVTKYSRNGYVLGDTTAVNGIEKNPGSWTFDEYGYGPFNCFYAAFDPSTGKMVCHLNPDDLGISIDGIDISGKGYNIMWCLPKIYLSNSGSTLTMSSSSDDGTLSPAFMIDGKDYNYLALGVYEATYDSALGSKSGQTPKASTSLENFRVYAKAANVEGGVTLLWNYHMYELYRMCSLAVMENFDSQSQIGYGNTFSSASSTTGRADSSSPYYGTTSSSITGVKLFIENAWGSLNEYVDDSWWSSGLYAGQNLNPTSDTNNKTKTTIISGLSGMGTYPYSTELDSWGLPTSVASSYSSTAPDKFYSSYSNVALIVGGYWSDNFSVGISYFDAYSVNGGSSFGTRMAFLFDEDPRATPIVTFDHSNLVCAGGDTTGFDTAMDIIAGATYPDLNMVIDNPSIVAGWTHVGWEIDGVMYDIGSNLATADSHTAYSIWQEPPITITFMVEGKVHSTLQVPKGSVGVVYTPEMVEGVFAGWYYDSVFKKKYDATVPLDTDVYLYALGVPPLIFTSEPTANATITPLYDGMVFFDATDSSGRYQIHWDFGDGNTSDEPIAYNTYTEPGRYTVTLTVTNIYGESATSTYEVDLRDGSAAENVKWFAIGALCVLAAGFVIRRIL